MEECIDIPRRIIIHIDLDCFYAQVEQKRLGIPRDVPCAVQQWDGLIAVNYAARARGISRHMRVGEARKACPELQLVHVRTIGEGGADAPETEGSAQSRGTAKACLQRYRQASGEIIRLLQSMMSRACPLEKGGLDEMFMDVTAMADEELHGLLSGTGRKQSAKSSATVTPPGGRLLGSFPSCADDDLEHQPLLPQHQSLLPQHQPLLPQHQGHACHQLQQLSHEGKQQQQQQQELPDADPGMWQHCLAAAFKEAAAVSEVVGGPLDAGNLFDRRLVVGALIAKRLRQAVLDQLQLTCSAGVAHNKILAKLGSSLHKPNKQAVILPRGTRDMMQDIPVGKIWGLGGKLGTALEQHFQATTAGQVQAVPLQQLQRVLGEEQAAYVAQRVRGQSCEPVVPKSLVKSINSCKSFNVTSDLATIEKWMVILADELAQRLADDEADNRRRARSLALHFTGGGGHAKERSVRCQMPQHGKEGPSATALAGAAMAVFRRLSDALPCVRIALSASDFTGVPVEGGRAITRFFTASPAVATAAGGSVTGPANKRMRGAQELGAAGLEVGTKKVQQQQYTRSIVNQPKNAAEVSQQTQPPSQQHLVSNQPSHSEHFKEQQHETRKSHHLQQEQQLEHASRRMHGPSQIPPSCTAADAPTVAATPIAEWQQQQQTSLPAHQPPRQQPQNSQHRSIEDTCLQQQQQQQQAGCDIDAAGFEGVDLDEQRRILHDIEIAKLLERGRPSGTDRPSVPGRSGRPPKPVGRNGGRAAKGGAGRGTQLSINAMFAKQQQQQR